jgi:hypothetical protein
VKDRLFEMEVRLLVLRYGREAVLEKIAQMGDQTLEEVQQQFDSAQLSRKPERSNARRQTVCDLIAVEVRDRPEIEESLRTIMAKFEARTFLPHLRDVRRFFDRIGGPDVGIVSRAAAGLPLVRALSKLKGEELAVLAKNSETRESDFSLLAQAIMGGSRRNTKVKRESRFLIKWSVGSDSRPIEMFSTLREALARLKELFITHGEELYPEIYENDLNRPLYGVRRLQQWNRGLLVIK